MAARNEAQTRGGGSPGLATATMSGAYSGRDGNAR
jgi:hypothetical protein